MNYLKLLIGFIGLSAFLWSCDNDDFLERYPLDQVTDAVFFKHSSDMEIYMNQFYNRGIFPLKYYSRGDVGSDIHMTGRSIDSRLEGTLTINAGPGLAYGSIRGVNYFFDNYKKCEDEFETYKQYMGEAYFFRAYLYFGLLKNFGDVQWISTVLETSSPELFEARDPRNYVADKIIADLDSAALYLSNEKTNGHSRLNKWTALLLQSRVALYEGTWEKYHANDPFGVDNPQPEKYFNKVVEATEKIMNSGLYDIYSTGSPETDYVDLFGLRDYSNNSEVMFWSKMNIDLGVHSHRTLDYLSWPRAMGLTKSLADSYLCVDGQPIAVSPLFQGYATIATEATNRDPRFYQTIFTPDAPWLIKDGNTTNWVYIYNKLFTNEDLTAPTGYQRRKDYNPNAVYHDMNFEETPSIQFRYAEVLLNFVEAKAELGSLIQNDIDRSVKKLRDRVGMPNLQINSIVPDPNWEFPDLSPVINEIRRERKIELVLEEFRFDDIARWAAADELLVGKRPKGAKSDQFSITPPYSDDENGFIDPFGTALPNGYGFNINRDYLYPIKETELVLNPNLGQNPGWDD
ncbi:RagB/SusD family nutrient uptake outer membrane protein [Maribellus luteus]|uniref:RagB/SusD family nutrient uptake outer membrane protein n=1 Tax=Maribellus luteus TaxID=2305463 RepID=A0A399SYE6_9BACT|nr:RagB/SusD family nutrient uptake outer membrane protein [Maribellus luteus]RIJ47077.1 RagB/SusD family nutrient uptake outer membrane protein [Maribellus luteus]